MIDIIVNGIWPGVYGVLKFMPQLFILFVIVKIFYNNKFLNKYFPFIVGASCSTVAITISKSKKQAVSIPLIPCSAKLPFLTMIISEFFNANFLMFFVFYFIAAFLSWLMFTLVGKFVYKTDENFDKSFIGKKEFSITLSMLSFVKKILTVVVIGSLVIYLLSNYSFSLQRVEFTESVLYLICNFISPVFTPLGFGNALSVAALISGLLGKELVMATLGVLGGVSGFTSISAFSFVLFFLIYSPCFSAIASLGAVVGKKQAVLWFFIYLIAAYIISLVFYNVAVVIMFNGLSIIFSVLFWCLLVAFSCFCVKLIKEKRREIAAKESGGRDDKTDCCSCGKTQCGQKHLF